MKAPIGDTIGKIVIFSLFSLPLFVLAQPAPIPFHVQPFTMLSGTHEGSADEAFTTAFRQVVSVSGAPWLRIHFGDYNLGKQSFITITSLKDHAQQRFDATSLKQWNGVSALFNGDAVEVELHVSSQDQGVFFEIKELIVGENAYLPETICGPNDDRTASRDPAVGRIVPVGCTGWAVSNGAYLTAGHCVGSGMVTLQFNVPASLNNGTIQNPGPQDQYPIIQSTIRFSNGGIGNDWALFNVGPNANGQRPIDRQRAFYRMSNDISPATFRVTGYGVDGPPPAFGTRPPGNTPRNADSQTQQTHTGQNLGETVSSANKAYFSYRVDTQGGNSGSPLIDGGNQLLTAGIHTNGGCNATGGGSNLGTSFEDDALETALRNYNGGPNVRYVDKGHPNVIENGTVFRPFDRVIEGVNAVPTGGTVSIVAGSYGEAITISRAMTLTATVGLVTIGP
jgi:V8-like Glu-specific endopeptidase